MMILRLTNNLMIKVNFNPVYSDKVEARLNAIFDTALEPGINPIRDIKEDVNKNLRRKEISQGEIEIEK